MKFKVWDPSGSDESCAVDIEADHPRDAAQGYASKQWSPDDGEEMNLLVRDESGEIWEACVDVDFEPSFYVSLTQVGNG